jgi:RNA 2',3'-cyclic 3'-phosphodiesterase
MRMFVALIPPPDAIEDLAEFIAPRQEAGAGLRWTVPEQWHVTLAFLGEVADRHLDDLQARLGRAAARRTSFPVTLAGGGAFPDPGRAKVVYVGVRTDGVELSRAATGVRAAAARAGADPEGGRFRPHVTLARSRHPVEATRWIRVLDTYEGPRWQAQEIALLASYLGEGPRRRPRHEVVETFHMAGARA